MSKDELLEFLKENLRVELSDVYQYYSSDGVGLKVTLYLGDDEITSDTIYQG